jgi:nucleoside-diphosphate-sugar epimerase
LKVLITGITGFAGSHMTDFLLKEKPEVEIFGIYRRRSRLEHLEHVLDRLHMIEPGVASIEREQTNRSGTPGPHIPSRRAKPRAYLVERARRYSNGQRVGSAQPFRGGAPGGH